jgi:hypothetical protein
MWCGYDNQSPQSAGAYDPGAVTAAVVAEGVPSGATMPAYPEATKPQVDGNVSSVPDALRQGLVTLNSLRDDHLIDEAEYLARRTALLDKWVDKGGAS